MTLLTLYDFPGSGNGYKVRLLLAQLGVPYRLVALDILKGETRTPEFLAINPNGKIPTVVLDDGTVLPESNAIMWYFAEGTPLVPDDRLGRAQVLSWLFFEQYSHEPTIAVARFILHFMPEDSPRRAELPRLQERGAAALDVLETRLQRHPFLVADRYSIADIALYAYTHVAGEGGFDLRRWPAIGDWLRRVREQPGHVPMDLG
ncbi:MAG: glutathione S-transferase family protein [Geminicoccaceae bacterium]